MDMENDEWQTQRARKNRRQRAWLSQPADGASVGGYPAQRGGRRQLPDWLRRDYEPPPPWRTGGKGGGKQTKREVAGEGCPWPFQGGVPKPRQDVKVPCCNPRCPGISGRQSFKFANSVGKGQRGHHCMACNMPWKRSWNVHFNGHSPLWGPEEGKAILA